MKRLLCVVACCVTILSENRSAQGQSGVYSSVADYKNNRLTYEVDCSGRAGSRKVHLNDFFGNGKYVTISSQGQKRKFRKSELYGYKDCNGTTYRFYDNSEYLVAEAGKIIIYTQTRNIAQSKGFKVVNVYYFGTSAGGNIYPLTMANLKAAYKDNANFTDMLDQYFSTGDLTEYDASRKTFKVNYIYNKAKK